MKSLTFIFLILITSLGGYSQSSDVKWIEGKILELDASGVHVPERDRTGYKYYFGTQHIKILTDKKDTLTVLRVFNILEDQKRYTKDFGLKVSEKYIFIVSEFNPCKSNFPQLTGYCEDGFFYPQTTNLLESYDRIYRVISTTLIR